MTGSAAHDSGTARCPQPVSPRLQGHVLGLRPLSAPWFHMHGNVANQVRAQAVPGPPPAWGHVRTTRGGCSGAARSRGTPGQRPGFADAAFAAKACEEDVIGLRLYTGALRSRSCSRALSQFPNLLLDIRVRVRTHTRRLSPTCTQSPSLSSAHGHSTTLHTCLHRIFISILPLCQSL